MSPISGAKNIDISFFPITCRLFLSPPSPLGAFFTPPCYQRFSKLLAFMCKKLYIFCVSSVAFFFRRRKKNGMKKTRATKYPPILKLTHKKSYFRFVEQSAKRISLSIAFPFCSAFCHSQPANNKLPFLCCSLRQANSHSTREEKSEQTTESEGKFNQVIKHFLLKHQLNLMVFLLPLLLSVSRFVSSFIRAVNNRKAIALAFYVHSIKISRSGEEERRRQSAGMIQPSK